MKNKITGKLFDIASSPRLTVAILVYGVILVFLTTISQTQIGIAAAQAEFIESFFGIFNAWGLKIPVVGGAMIGILAIVNLLTSGLRFVKFGARGLGESIIHVSLMLLIVSGALQYFMREEGTVTLREGEPVDAVYAQMSVSDFSMPRIIRKLPFSLRLKNFTSKKWEGSDIPKSFESEIWFERGNDRILQVVKMNSPASFGGWTFYQMSYAEGGKVSVLAAVRNPARLLPWIAVGGVFTGMLLIFLPRAFRKGDSE